MTEPTRDPRKEPKPRPAPVPEQEAAEYWAATLEGRLLVQRCTACGHHQLYPRVHCLECRSPVTYVESAGKGTIYSRTIIRQNMSRSFRHLLPYVVALVDLDEGPRLMTNIVNVPADDVHIGDRVRVLFEPVSEQAALPLFEPDA